MKTKSSLIAKFGMILPIVGLMAFSAQAQEKGKPWPAPETAVKMKNPVASNEASLAEGKTLYMKHCKSCHGPGGKGDGPKAANLDITCGDFTSAEFKKETAGTIYWKTTEGRDPMPTFKAKATDDERWKIVNFIQTLK